VTLTLGAALTLSGPTLCGLTLSVTLTLGAALTLSVTQTLSVALTLGAEVNNLAMTRIINPFLIILTIMTFLWPILLAQTPHLSLLATIVVCIQISCHLLRRRSIMLVCACE
jgi:hypothetical protein